MKLEQWQALRAADLERARALIVPQTERRSRHETHPVFDFLFEYYSFRPAHLMRWTPGSGVFLEEGTEEELPAEHGFVRTEGGRCIGPIPEKRRDSAQWVVRFLENTQTRPPSFGCHGLHEWAMVYDAADIRHSKWPLRMEHGALRDFVASQRINCTHFDAFRFFSQEARQMNRVQPTSAARIDLEQPGCIHASMDLYKWAYKFHPWVSTRFILDAFELAFAARVVDMRASPYDFTRLGFEPIPIETPAGRREYEEHQRGISTRAVPLRTELINALCRALG